MTSDDLTIEQAEALYQQVGERLAYFTRLRDRMERQHWEPNDRLYVLVKEIQAKVQHLDTHLHYLRLQSGGGRRRRG